MATSKTPPAPAPAPAPAPEPLEPGIPDLSAQPQPAPYMTSTFRTIIVNGSTYKTDLTGTLIGRADASGVWHPGVDPADALTLALHGFPAVVSYDTGETGEEGE